MRAPPRSVRPRFQGLVSGPPVRYAHQSLHKSRVQDAGAARATGTMTRGLPAREEMVGYKVVELLALLPAASFAERFRIRMPKVPMRWRGPGRGLLRQNDLMPLRIRRRAGGADEEPLLLTP